MLGAKLGWYGKTMLMMTSNDRSLRPSMVLKTSFYALQPKPPLPLPS
jgi:hypothetical protein